MRKWAMTVIILLLILFVAGFSGRYSPQQESIIAEIEVEHRSPSQHGGIYGTVYRQYHGAKAHNESVSTPGIATLLVAAGRWNTINVYNGYTDQGTSSIRPLKGTDQVTFIIVGTMPINEGWVDYTK